MRAAWVFLLLFAGCQVADGISREIGAACVTADDCEDRCLASPRWPQGFCSRDCHTTPSCPVGSACVPTVDGEVCLFLCFDDPDCGFLESEEGATAWACRVSGEVKVCAPEGA